MAHYQVLTNVQIQQIPSKQFPDRSKLLVFSFLNRYSGESTWADLTQTLKLVLPKNVKIKAYEITGNWFDHSLDIKSSYVYFGNVEGENRNLGGFDGVPSFLRGDLIKFNTGYRAMVNGGETTLMSGQNDLPDQFNGVISSVNPKLPFTLECEDYMWLLKQMPTKSQQWNGKSLQDIVSETIEANKDNEIISKYKGFIDLKVSDFSKTDLVFQLNNINTYGESLAAFIARMKAEYKVDSYFRGQELRIGLLHYLPADTRTHTFTFQKNIIEDSLKWQRKDDIVLSMIIKSCYVKKGQGETKDGKPKTVQATTEILIYNDAGKWSYIEKEKGKPYPGKYLDVTGKRMTWNIQSPITDAKELFKLGVPIIEKVYYTGFKGSFTTFGIPHVRHGDTVKLVSKSIPGDNGVTGQNGLPEFSGLYKVKAVRFYGGFDDGLRQDITIDYRVDNDNTPI